MTDKLQHVGVLGMKWGRRKRPTLEGHGEVRRTISGKLMAKDGTIATTRRGKLIPKTVSVRGKPVEVNGRAISSFIDKVKHKKLTDVDTGKLEKAEKIAKRVLAVTATLLAVDLALRINSIRKYGS